MKWIKELMELLFVVGFIVACHVVEKTNYSVAPAFDKQGHRGCRGLMPENTIPAMLKALEFGVTTLEMDAVITGDKQVILSHEPFFSHEITTQPDGKTISAAEEKNFNIYKMTYFETQQFDVGLKPHPRFLRQQRMPAKKPLLADVIDSVEQYCHSHKLPLPFYNIETKSQPFTDNLFHPAPEEFLDLIMKVINFKGIAQRTIIQSFDFRTLHVLNKKYPRIKAAALVEDFDKRSLDVHLGELSFIPAIYSPHHSLVTDQLIKTCHTRNIKVIPWTVNDKPTMDQLRKMGVDGIITDYPDLFPR
jgi:glycerophosphoryl diester phosphodiesterase